MTQETRRPYHHGDLPTVLLRAVAEQVAENGAAAVGLRETARRAGVSHPAVTHHFGDLQGLLTAFAAQGHGILAPMLATALDHAGEDTEARVLEIGLTYVRFAAEHPAHFAVMFRPDLIDPDAPEIEATGQRNFDVLATAVGAHQQTGWQPDHDPLALTVMVWGCVHGIAQLWLGGLVERRLERDGIEALTRPLLELVLRRTEARTRGT